MAKHLIQTSISADGIGYLTLDDPSTKNAMSEAMATEFHAAVQALQRQQELRVLILRGAGEAFSAGGHLEMLQAKTALSPAENESGMQSFYANFLSIMSLEVPTIAAINGHAIGAGLCVALACDMRVAVKRAKLGLNFVQLGLHPGMGATYLVPRLVGPAKAAELLFAGKVIGAEEACAIGMVNEVADDSTFATSVAALAQKIASAGTQAVRELKTTLRTSSSSSLQDCLDREAYCQSLDYASAEFNERIANARAKRSS